MIEKFHLNIKKKFLEQKYYIKDSYCICSLLKTLKIP
jgi:hypothetical protein